MSVGSPRIPPPSPSLRELQAGFLRALRSPDAALPEGIEHEPGRDAGARVGVYRTAYRERLRAVLRSDHSAAAHALGSRFSALADAYIQAHPSHAHSLRTVGDQLPEFVAGYAIDNAAALASLIAFERALLDAFDAAEQPRCTADGLTHAIGTHGPAMRIALHPSVRALEPGWNVVEYWQAHHAGTPPPPWTPSTTRWVLWRGVERRTNFRTMPSEESRLFDEVRRGASLAEVCEALTEVMPGIHVPPFVASTLGRWAHEGLIAQPSVAAAPPVS